MCSQSAPSFIILVHSAVSFPKSEARMEGAILAVGVVILVVVVVFLSKTVVYVCIVFSCNADEVRAEQVAR